MYVQQRQYDIDDHRGNSHNKPSASGTNPAGERTEDRIHQQARQKGKIDRRATGTNGSLLSCNVEAMAVELIADRVKELVQEG